MDDGQHTSNEERMNGERVDGEHMGLCYESDVPAESGKRTLQANTRPPNAVSKGVRAVNLINSRKRDDHARAKKCKSGPFSHDGLSAEQQIAIQREADGSGNDSVEAWYRLWDILFRGTPRPDSPHLSESEFVERLRFAIQSLCDQGSVEQLLEKYTAERRGPLADL